MKTESAAANPSRESRERRSHPRYEADTSAVLSLVKLGSRLSGRIADLSLTGCRIRCDEPFPLGIYTRVEAEFSLEGLPFRLGGVVQAIHDRYMIGIRFLDLSSRKRDHVQQLMEEMEKDRERGNKGPQEEESRNRD